MRQFRLLARGQVPTDGPYVDPGKTSLFGLKKSKPVFDEEAAKRRFAELSQPAYVTLNAPQVGRDAEADAWVRAAFEEGRFDLPSAEQALDALKGYYALEAMEPCDGFPVYSHAYMYDGVDRTSFRGAFLTECEKVLEPEILNRAWEIMTAEELAQWSKALLAVADRLAGENGFEHVLGDQAFRTDDPGALPGQIHIIDQAGRWAAFWSSRGHGAEPYF
ncbi:hypothetical protein [Thalassococcus sp. S3]|uniref:hypothetical protein n=1 Tax=Thalassococcus sp. S3 TaxID=2017482 RepID=UPI00102B1904|nr:hypothetical protein [Thalassococcus sp. S3]